MRDVLAGFITRELLSNRGGVAVAPDDDLLGSGLVDSLGIISLVFFIEQEFCVEVPPEDVTIENFQSVARIEAYLRRRSA